MFNADFMIGEVSEKTVENYNRYLREYRGFCNDNELDSLDLISFNAYRTHLVKDTDMSPVTINARLDGIRSVYRSATLSGFVPHEKGLSFKMVKRVRLSALKDRISQTRRTHIDRNDMVRICNSPNAENCKHWKRDRAILHTLATSGIRVSELCKMKAADITQKGDGYIVRVIGKTDITPRVAYLSQLAYKYIEEHLSDRSIDSEYIFASHYGKSKGMPMTRQSVNLVVKKYADLLGLKNIKPHDFRRYVATQIAAINPMFSSQAVGHVNIMTTLDSYITSEPPVGLTDNLTE